MCHGREKTPGTVLPRNWASAFSEMKKGATCAAPCCPTLTFVSLDGPNSPQKPTTSDRPTVLSVDFRPGSGFDV